MYMHIIHTCDVRTFNLTVQRKDFKITKQRLLLR